MSLSAQSSPGATTLLDAKLTGIRPAGDLAYRAQLNFARLECHHYRSPEVFRTGYGWPGDWEGRTLLALVQLAQMLGRAPLFIEQILEELPRRINARGYFGPVWESGPLDEQQIAGQSWYLRSMIELAQWQGDEIAGPLLDQFVRNFLLRADEAYAQYPTTPEARQLTQHWQLSNFNSETSSPVGDVGCAFIMLDGVTAALQHLEWPELQQMAERMIERYAQLDFVGCGTQTHATLSGLRGVARYHEMTGSAESLAIVRRIYALYRSQAWTENYANFNWFGNPHCTETCAVVDSLLLATWLWRQTGETSYLDDAHLIYYNGLVPHQRERGCFGTDTCLGPREQVLRPDLYDVTWCCTMRAAEGLTFAARSIAQTSADALQFLNYHEGELELATPGGPLRLRLRSEYPQAGSFTLEVIAAPGGTAPLACEFFVPSWSDAASWAFAINGQSLAAEPCRLGLRLEWTPKVGDVLRAQFGLSTLLLPTHNPFSAANHHRYRHGALLLAGANGDASPAGPHALEAIAAGQWRMRGTDYLLGPLFQPGHLTDRASARRVLFAGPCEAEHLI